MEELPKRIPAHATQAPEEWAPATDMSGESDGEVLSDQLLTPPTGEPVSTELPEAVVAQKAEKRAKMDALLAHQRDIRLGRKIFALTDEEEEAVPVRLIATDKVTPEYKSLMRDASYEVHKSKHLAQTAETNPVTGLPNRRAFDELLKHTVTEAERGGDNDIAVAMLDLDGFKAVNDTRGHGFGDIVLREFGLELQRAVRESDVVMHFGGDEFAVVMPEYRRDGHEPLPKPELSIRMTNRFRDAAERVTEKLGAKVGASVGIGIYERGDTPETVTEKADKLMYEDKMARKTEQPAGHKPRTRLRDKFHNRKKRQTNSAT